jgi:3',5'-cyclic AMP phosphodiesterase CpdA
MSDPIRWLHLSDFHVGKDDWAQRRLFEKIIEHVADQKGKGFIPDVVFITGDIANAGQKSQYTEFHRGFFAPLQDALGARTDPERYTPSLEITTSIAARTLIWTARRQVLPVAICSIRTGRGS